ncbi:MAG TPA: SDR family oxidoreductase [Blastocatellia bacterium]|nr:SDR family oxidoreductase [Blastocatellia bacterium]
MDFKDKSVIITGASAGIGEELAVALAGRGARLTLAARSADALERTARRCREAGGQAITVPTDVGDEQSCRQMVERAVEQFGGVDVLVNNAGIGMWARFEEVTDLSIYDQIMRINYLGSVYSTYYALPYLKKSRGLIVAVSSLTGKTGVPTRTGYAASKHAMQGFFDSLRIELRGTGVDVLIVSPGFVATDIRARALGGDGRARGESPREEGRDTMSVEECVRLMVGAMERRRRELVMTIRGRLAQWVRLIAPGLVDQIALRAVREKR